MSLQFIFGGSGKGKSYYLQHFISKEAKLFPERQYLFVVPEQFTMQTQKELIAISDEKGIMNIDVQSFLRLAFRVLGIGAGDEVIVQGNTYIASVMGITINGATPVFVEPDKYNNIDTTKIEEKITDRKR